MMKWTKEDYLTSWKHGWGIDPDTGTPFRRRGFNRWKDTPEMVRWLYRQAEAGDPLCSKAVAYSTFKKLTT